jgi:formamidopyrimidine-DNA glycosylase
LPELPEVETIVRDLRDLIVGRKIIGANLLRKSVWRKNAPKPAMLVNSAIDSIERKGKNILIHLSNGRTLIVHLKMTGRLTFEIPTEPIKKHTHLVIDLDGAHLRFNDVRRFGYLDLVETAKLSDLEYLAILGRDALEISEDDFVKLIRSRGRVIKSMLLDQTIISGLGNIYSDESLFLAKIYPKKVSSKLSKAKVKKLYAAIRQILLMALKNRGSSIDNYVDARGEKGSHQNYFSVYGREGEPCLVCGHPIKRIIIGSRSCHYCPHCQK